jgi:putative transposase
MNKKKPPDIQICHKYIIDDYMDKKIMNFFKKLKFNYFKYRSFASPTLLFFHHTFILSLNTIFNKIHNDGFTNEQNIMPSFFKFMQNNMKLQPFWNNNIKKLSNKIFLPSYENITLKSNDCFKSLNNSWFTYSFETGKSTNYHVRFNKNPIYQGPVTRVRQIGVKFTKDQKIGINKIIGGYRYFYNRTIDYINNLNYESRKSYFYIDPKDKTTKIKLKIPNGLDLLSMFDLRIYLKNNHPEWLIYKFPSHLIDLAIGEAFSKFKNNLKNTKKSGKGFNMKYKTKKDIYQTINLETNMINEEKNGFFVDLNINENKDKLIYLKTIEDIYNFEFGGSTLTYHSVLKTYTLNLTYKKQIKNTITKDEKIASIDSGDVIFQDIYTEDHVIKIGEEARQVIYKLCKELDIIKSRINVKEYKVGDKVYKMNSNRKRNLRKAFHRKIRRIQNMIKEIHYKTANYLTKSYSKIILPPFETQKMVSKLGSKTARSMCTFSHYKFKKILNDKCKERNVDLVSIDESYTSQTCTRCGTLQKPIGREYNCKECGLKINRDHMGSRNIFLKGIVKHKL